MVKEMNYILLVLLAVFAVVETRAQNEDSLKEKLVRLDECLQKKAEYDKAKEKEIQKFRDALCRSRGGRAKYEACIRLYDAYKSYQYDSAYAYANHSAMLARQLNNADYQAEAGCAMTFCLLSAGLYKEAFDKLGSINAENISQLYKKKYYFMVIQLNYAIADYNHAEPYHTMYMKRGNDYTDSLLAVTAKDSPEWQYAVAQKQMKEYKYDESMATFENMLRTNKIDLHTKAIVTSCLGWMRWHAKEEKTALLYLAEAAICDVKSSTKETTALRGLAELLYKNGEIQRARIYTAVAGRCQLLWSQTEKD